MDDSLPYQYLSRYQKEKWREEVRLFAPHQFAPKDRGLTTERVVIQRHRLKIVLELRLV